MGVKTQGGQLFGLFPKKDDPGKVEVLQVKFMTNFNGGDNPADNIVLEYLDETSRQNAKGMRSPSQATFTIDVTPSEESHVRMYEAAASDADEYEVISWLFGWADGPRGPDGTQTAKPTVNADGTGWAALPTTRTFFGFDGYVVGFPMDHAANTMVKTAVSIQRSGAGVWHRKAAA